MEPIQITKNQYKQLRNQRYVVLKLSSVLDFQLRRLNHWSEGLNPGHDTYALG